MAHYAKIEFDKVTQVIKADADFILNMPGEWVKTSYNTVAGEHTTGKTPLRKNYAGVGYLYHRDADAFSPPSPYESWDLNTTTYLWEAPEAMPNDGKEYTWNEGELEWQIMQR